MWGGGAIHRCVPSLILFDLTIQPKRFPGNLATFWISRLLDYIEGHHSSVSVVLFFSDDPCTLYRQKGNFFLFSTELSKRGFEWHLEFLWSKPRQVTFWWCWRSDKKTGRSAWESVTSLTLPHSNEHYWHLDHLEALWKLRILWIHTVTFHQSQGQCK